MSDFNEADHPRTAGGEFRTKGQDSANPDVFPVSTSPSQPIGWDDMGASERDLWVERNGWPDAVVEILPHALEEGDRIIVNARPVTITRIVDQGGTGLDVHTDGAGRVAISKRGTVLANKSQGQNYQVPVAVPDPPATGDFAQIGEALAADERNGNNYAINTLVRSTEDPGVLAQAALHPSPGIRANVAMNPATPARTLGHLAKDEREDVRCAVAKNPHTPADSLAPLQDDSDEHVRRALARNPSAPPSALRSQAASKDLFERRLVGGNPSTPTDVLVTLAADSEQSVREYVATNPAAPREVLTALSEDSFPIGKIAKATLASLDSKA